MSTVFLKNVSKIFDNGFKSVDNINLSVNDKEFVVLLGPSGCGKTTILRMIAGLEEITSGDLFLDNVLVNNMLSKDRDIAMVFQNYILYPQMTVFENMSVGLRNKKSIPKLR